VSPRTLIDSASIPRLPRHVKLRFDQTRQAWILLAPERVFMPDEIALEILQRCDGSASVGTIAAALTEKFQAAREEVERDVIELLQEMADKGTIAV
jgi:pyrroloquinoline quinone biosynthesis protein D